MAFFKPDWERTLKLLYAVGETLTTGDAPKGLNEADTKLVKLTAGALEGVVKGIVHVISRVKR